MVTPPMTSHYWVDLLTGPYIGKVALETSENAAAIQTPKITSLRRLPTIERSIVLVALEYVSWCVEMLLEACYQVTGRRQLCLSRAAA
jgi:hypothetical protein